VCFIDAPRIANGLYVAFPLLLLEVMRLQQVIVAGAGLAGLCAAHELANAGVEVTLIEQGYMNGAVESGVRAARELLCHSQ
jgi:monoamine oxidase